jgi:Fe-S oxidoreductase
MKVEFLHHYKARHGYTLKDKLIASLPDYAHWASRFAPLLNLRDTLPGLAKLSEKIIGFSARRTLPQWQRQTFWQQLSNAASQPVGAPANSLNTATREEVMTATKPVVLFVDTFNGTFEAGNARAALQVLQAAGYTVHVATKAQPDGKHLCCGRTYLANGMIDEAKVKAAEVVDSLLPFAEKGIAIVGLEPSCLLTLRDEMLVMGLGPDAQTISDHALLFEEFLAREAAAGQLDALKSKLKATDQAILLHGHCHQKAFGAVSPIIDVLKLIPGAQPELIESRCCGMAGSFGYEASHYEVSMQMAELSLLPAVRKQPNAIVVADGTSCRHQIRDGAQRESIHVAELLARHLQQSRG